MKTNFLLTFLLTILINNKGLNCNADDASDDLLDEDGHRRGIKVLIISKDGTAELGQFPWQAALKVFNEDGTVRFCGGSLIHPKWILSAAQCIFNVKKWRIALGINELNVINKPKAILITSQKGYVHEDYQNDVENDIGLIHLPITVPLSETINTIKLPAYSELDTMLENVTALVHGWGLADDNDVMINNKLNFAPVTIVPNAICSYFYKSVFVDISTLCITVEQSQRFCYGDDGGSLITFNNNLEPVQIGIAIVYNTNGCQLGLPNIFTRVSSYLQWIHQKTGILIQD